MKKYKVYISGVDHYATESLQANSKEEAVSKYMEMLENGLIEAVDYDYFDPVVREEK